MTTAQSTGEEKPAVKPEATLINGQEVYTPVEAAAYLGLTPQEFGAVTKQYGIGRHHVSRDFDQIVYFKVDLTNVKNVLDKTPPAKAKEAKAAPETSPENSAPAPPLQ
jgi:hypothetical protein